MPFFLNNMVATETVTATIREVRAICDTFTADGLPNFPSGIPFTYWEQYLNLRFYLMLSFICVFIGIFVVLTVSLMNPWVASIVVSSITLLDFWTIRKCILYSELYMYT